MNAIPTMYAGVQFRSRLEARWAAFFDLAGWRWEYEPLDLNGYIPDFVVFLSTTRVLVEVKPALVLADFEDARRKIEQSGWLGYAVCVGASIEIDDASDRALVGSLRCQGANGDWHWQGFALPFGSRQLARWRDAANRVQWRGGGSSR